MYEPKVDDYVYWNSFVEGWVYFKITDYITIEISVTPKDVINYEAAPFHKNNRVLVCCYKNDWNNLTYIKSR